jgi:hypothetical protein
MGNGRTNKGSNAPAKPASFNRPKPASGKARPVRAQAAPDTSGGSQVKGGSGVPRLRDAGGKC